MSKDVAISVENISKAYRIWESPAARLTSPLWESASRLFPDQSRTARNLKERSARHYRDFWALQDVSFEVKKGESVGFIGRNGSGKSTLLQIIAGTLQPTSGSVNVVGRIAALLELGSGFNPEFTGLENVELNASILGLTRQETGEKLDSILAFADIGSFIKEPVKTYSSGMMVRLAFSVATHVDADLLLVDEALAVGDVFFQQKCYQRLEALKDKGAAIILVSHGLNDVEQFCSRALLLRNGKVHSIGPAPQIVKEYYLVNRDTAKTNAPNPTAHATDDASPSIPKISPEVLGESSSRSTEPSARHVQNFSSADASFGVSGSLLKEHTRWPHSAAFLNISATKQITDGTARCVSVGITDRSGQPCLKFEQGQTACIYYEYELLRDIETPVVGLVLFNRKGVIVHGKNSIEYGSPMPAQVTAGSILRCCQFVQLDLQVDLYTLEVGLASIRNSDLRNASDLLHTELSACITRHCHLTGLGPFEIGFRNGGKPVQLLHHGIANLSGSVEIIS